MYQAIEAVCQQSRIQPLEPVSFDENEHLVILRLPRIPATFTPPAKGIRGAMKGMLSSVDEFIAAKNADKAMRHNLSAEPALAQDWLKPEEDEAWAHLQSDK